jgi:Leucine-rich repeat (LRR) protein
MRGSADADVEIHLPASPYPGLRPFEKGEWPIFFGREKMTGEVVDQLIRCRLVVVHGDSGCGKSSLIRAGVLASLEQAQVRGGNRWRTFATLPRRDPLGNLARALAELDGYKGSEARILEFRRIINFGLEAPAALAEALQCNEHDQICILIDQFEELFDFAKSGGLTEARLLVDVLIGLLEKPPPGFYALITMRSEFLGSCARFRGFAEAVNSTQYLLPQMDEAALLRAIREPALLYEGEVSRELAERLIVAAGSGQDQLPLIQHGLMLLYRQKMGPAKGPEPTSPEDRAAHRRWRLAFADYSSGPDLESLLSNHADSVMAAATRLPDSQKSDPKRERIVEDLFRALTDTNVEGQAIRRPQTVEQLAAVTGGDAGALRSILDCFRAEGVSFLTPYGEGPLGDAELIDISHEALIRCWKRIADSTAGWRDREFRDGIIWRGLLTRSDLLGPNATSEIERLLTRRNEVWSRRYGGGWDQVERLVEASRQEADRQSRLARAAELAELQRLKLERLEAEREAERLEAARQRAEAEAAKQRLEANAALEREQAARRKSIRMRIAVIAVSILALIALAMGGVLAWNGPSPTKLESYLADLGLSVTFKGGGIAAERNSRFTVDIFARAAPLLDRLSGFTRVHSLDLSGTQVTSLEPLKGLTALQSLDLRGTPVTSLEPLEGLTALQSLNLSGTQVASVEPLKGLTALQTLYLTGTKVVSVEPLKGLTALQTLYLTGTKVVSVEPLKGLTALQTLYLTGTKVVSVEPLKGLTALQTLDLSGTQVTSLEPLKGLTALQSLDLRGTQVTSLEPLKGLTALQSLDLRGTPVTSLEPLRGLIALQTLDLTGTKVESVEPLKGLTALQTLDLTGTKVVSVEPLKGLTALQKLDLRNTSVKSVDLPDLRRLDLTGTKVESVKTKTATILIGG